MKLQWGWIASLLLGLLLIGCSSDSNDTPPGGDTDSEVQENDTETTSAKLWDTPDDSAILALEEDDGLPSRFPWLIDERVTWITRYDRASRFDDIDLAALGYLGASNGRVFGFVGTTDPIHTVHEFVGPDLQADGSAGWFPDVGVRLFDGETEVFFKTGLAWRIRETGINVTRAVSFDDSLEVVTVTFAPWGDVGAASNALVQMIQVINRSDASRDGLRLAAFPATAPDATKTETWEVVRHHQRMRLKFLNGTNTQETLDDTRTLFTDLPTVEAKSSTETTLAFLTRFEKDWAEHCKAEDDSRFDEVEQALSNPDTLLETTKETWKTWRSGLVVLDTPDPYVNDLFDSLVVTVKSSMAENGSISEMSHYTNMWQRDTYPPLRWLYKLGGWDDARAILDYSWLANKIRGGINNAYESNYTVDTEPEEPDWSERQSHPFSGRMAGEGPSYLVLYYLSDWKYTGSLERIKERWRLMQHALDGQPISEGGLMEWSGDETFRVGYGVNIGYDAQYVWEDHSYSLNSSLLYVVATEQLAEAAEKAQAEGLDAEHFRQLAEPVREGIEQRYWLEDKGYYGAFIDKETLVTSEFPSEDVNTKLFWLGYAAPDEERAVQNVLNVYKRIGVGDGVMQTAEAGAGELMGFDVSSGLAVGMTLGYQLYCWSTMEHASYAEGVFNTLPIYATTSGNYPEIYAFNQPNKSLQVIYDPSSRTGEIWGKYRSWEGAIVGEAMQQYLTGFEPDAREKTVDFAIHLPNDWPSFTVENLRLEDSRITLTVESLTDGVRIKLASDKASGYVAQMAYVGSDESWTVARVGVCGEETDATVTTTSTWEGATTYRFASTTLDQTELCFELEASGSK